MTNHTHTGRIIDAKRLVPISSAQITLELEGKSQIVHCDCEGFYEFYAPIKSESSSACIRVSKQGYQDYKRIITILAKNKKIEEVHLQPNKKQLKNVIKILAICTIISTITTAIATSANQVNRKRNEADTQNYPNQQQEQTQSISKSTSGIKLQPSELTSKKNNIVNQPKKRIPAAKKVRPVTPIQTSPFSSNKPLKDKQPQFNSKQISENQSTVRALIQQKLNIITQPANTAPTLTEIKPQASATKPPTVVISTHETKPTTQEDTTNPVTNSFCKSLFKANQSLSAFHKDYNGGVSKGWINLSSELSGYFFDHPDNGQAISVRILANDLNQFEFVRDFTKNNDGKQFWKGKCTSASSATGEWYNDKLAGAGTFEIKPW